MQQEEKLINGQVFVTEVFERITDLDYFNSEDLEEVYMRENWTVADMLTMLKAYILTDNRVEPFKKTSILQSIDSYEQTELIVQSND